LIKRLLSKVGAIVTEASSPDEARKSLRDHQPDVIVSDIGMPGESGVEFIAKLRASASAALKNIPAVALTAYVREEEKQSMMTAGFQAHVGKPVSGGELVAAISELLSRART
jgi:CheY-like chemotaxis protein